VVEKKVAFEPNDHSRDTIVLMVSVGDRRYLTDYTFPRVAAWAALHGYSCMLIKKDQTEHGLAPHFNKLIACRLAPGFSRYIIVDDDLLMKAGSPPVEDIPPGKIGLSPDAIQTLTQAKHVQWTANTGFIVAGREALYLLEEAYQSGEYPFNCWDGSGEGIWGPHDQSTLNDLLFRVNKIHQLDSRWNYQALLDFYENNGKGWHKWRSSRSYRIGYYLSLLLPFSKNRQLLKKSYGVHMIMGLYPRFFSFLLT
jgi:hypothetical protein